LYGRSASALALYPFAPWQGSAATFVGIIGSTMGPVFGIIMVDYYLIRNGEIEVPELYRERGVYRYTNGWNVNAVIAAAVGAVFSSILPNFTNILPSWWGVYGWFFGVAIGGTIYYLLVKTRGAPATRVARPA
jgi:NCS1 family nucleobase:cation symporter-1